MKVTRVTAVLVVLLSSTIQANKYGSVEPIAQSHRALSRIRAFHLSVTREVLRKLEHGDKRSGKDKDVVSFDCR